MKVVIVGAGIGGLTTYLALRKHLSDTKSPLTLKIYESHSSPAASSSAVGLGLGLAPNGQRALKSVSPEAEQSLNSESFHGPKMTFRNSAGTFLGKFWGGNKERHGFDLLWRTRGGVHEALLGQVPKDAIEWNKKVVEVRESRHDVDVKFEDGTVERADLVIGADGLRSVVREAVVGKDYQVTYDAITGIGGLLSLSSLPENLQKLVKSDPITMNFGPSGMFGLFHCNYDADGQLFWWSTRQCEAPLIRDEKISDIRKMLLEQHGSWKSPYDSDGSVYLSLINLVCGSEKDPGADTETAEDRNILVLPRYLLPQLPYWCSQFGRIMLLGDAAHAMPPDSGQGVSMALEDSVALALLLKNYLKIEGDEEDAIRRTARAFEGMRMPRLEQFLKNAQRSRGNRMKKTWWQEKVRDWILWLVCNLPQSTNDHILQYDVEEDVAKYVKFHP